MNVDLGDLFPGSAPLAVTMTMWFKMPLSGREGALIGKWVLNIDEPPYQVDRRVFRVWRENTTSTMQF
jgi:hypothetical protein